MNQIAQRFAGVVTPPTAGTIDRENPPGTEAPTWDADHSPLTTDHSPPGTKIRYFGERAADAETQGFLREAEELMAGKR
jgi:hypothetical protein